MSIYMTSGIASVIEQRFFLAFANHAPMITSQSNAPHRCRDLERKPPISYAPHLTVVNSMFFQVKTDQTSHSSGITSSEPLGKASPCGASRLKQIYNVHRQSNSRAATAGTGVYSVDELCPPYGPPDYDIFSSTFGIEIDFGSEAFIQQFSTYEMVPCFQMTTCISFTMAHP